MENLWNQMRVQFTGGEENKADLGGTRNQKIPIQKTQSFKAEKKKGHNWFQKQFARKSTSDYDSREMEHAAAVAAAAFAINLQEVSEQKSETPEASLTKTKSKVDGTKSSISLLGSASKRFSGSFRSKDDQGNKVPTSSITEEKKPEKAITPASSKKTTSTFTDKKPKTPASKVPPPPPPTPPIRQTSTKPVLVRQPTPPPGIERQTPSRPSIGESKADEWERTELDKIGQRYDKLKEKIDSWENQKKMKARRKLIKQESELERRRLKAMKNFQNKMTYIDQIAEGARARAEESQKNEELKAREKAHVIRTTGKLPGICFCF